MFTGPWTHDQPWPGSQYPTAQTKSKYLWVDVIFIFIFDVEDSYFGKSRVTADYMWSVNLHWSRKKLCCFRKLFNRLIIDCNKEEMKQEDNSQRSHDFLMKEEKKTKITLAVTETGRVKSPHCLDIIQFPWKQVDRADMRWVVSPVTSLLPKDDWSSVNKHESSLLWNQLWMDTSICSAVNLETSLLTRNIGWSKGPEQGPLTYKLCDAASACTHKHTLTQTHTF